LEQSSGQQELRAGLPGNLGLVEDAMVRLASKLSVITPNTPRYIGHLLHGQLKLKLPTSGRFLVDDMYNVLYA